MTPQQFLSKNLKWITIIIGFLFLVKSIQSCNRNNTISLQKQQSTYIIDSITNTNNELKDSIKELHFELKLANKDAKFANEKASAIQSVAEKVKNNQTTTVKIQTEKQTEK